MSDGGDSIRAEYQRHGAAAYYQRFGKNYRNPHEPAVVQSLREAAARWPLKLERVLDLAAGSGEATLALRELGAGEIVAIDPYTAEAYEHRTGNKAAKLTFADVAAGALAGQRYDLVVCSFALHLCEISRLPGVVRQLAMVAGAMVIVTPHKRPVIRAAWGWKFVDELVIDRVRTRYYLSAEC